MPTKTPPPKTPVIKTSQWFKNAGKSSASIGANVLKNIMPTTYNSASEMREAMREARSFASRFNSLSRTQDMQQARSRAGKAVKNKIDEVLNDIKSGNFGIKKANDEMFDDFNDDFMDDFDINFADDAEESEKSPEEIMLMGNRGIAKTVMRTGSAQLEAMQHMTETIVGSNVKTSQATAIQTINAINYVGNMLNANLIGINSRLDTINKNLVSMIEFQNENVSVTNQAILKYIEDSSIMFRDMGKMMENWQKHRSGTSRTSRGVNFKSMGFDFAEYKDFVKGNFNNSLVGSVIQLAPMLMQSDDGHKFGIGDVLSLAVQAALPKNFKKTLGRVDKNIGRYLQESIYRIGDLKRSSNPFVSFIGELFGMERKGIRNADMSRYTKDQLPWNGMAQKALVEVIPEYLASIEAQLKNMDKRYMDYETGTFKTLREIQKQNRSEISGKYAMEMMDPTKKLMQYLKENGITAEEQKKIMSQVNQQLDRRIQGRTSVRQSRANMGNVLHDLNDQQFARVMMGFEDAIESFTEYMNERNDMISETQSVYRNLYNKSGARQRIGKLDAFGMMFSSPGSMTARELIETTLKKAGRDNPTLVNDFDFQKEITAAMLNKTDPEIIARMIIQEDNRKQMGNKFKSFLNKFKRERAMSPTAQIENAINDVDAAAFYKIYGIKRESRTPPSRRSSSGGGDDDGGGGPQPPRGPRPVTRMRAASSNMTRRQGTSAGSSQEIRSANRSRNSSQNSQTQSNITDLTKRIVENTTQGAMDLTEQEMADNTAKVGALIDEQNDAELDTSLEGSVAQLANAAQIGMLSITNSFQNLTGGIFGKNGIFKKFFESDAFKKMMNGVKEKLIGKDGLFHDQWEALKRGAGKVWSKTKGHLVNAYDFVYSNTMRYAFGDDYRESSAYKKVFRHLDLKTNLKERDLRKRATKIVNERAKAEGRTIVTKEEIEAEIENLRKNGGKAPSTTKQNQGSTKDNIIDFKTAAAAKSNTTSTDKKNNIIEFKAPAKRNPDGTITPTNGTVKVNVNDKGKIIQLSSQAVADASAETAQDIRKGGKNLSETMFGDQKASKKKKALEFFSKYKKVLPKALAAGIIGAGAVALSGGSMGLLGSLFLPGSVIGGAIVGAGGMILSQTEAFKNIMFGKMDDKTGERQGGFINKKMVAAFKKSIPAMVGGATLGALKHIITGGNGIFSMGPLGAVTGALLPGGVLGGAILGLGLGLLKNNDTIKEKLFGKKDENGRRSGGKLSSAYNKLTEGIKKNFPKIKRGAAGLGTGALTGLVLSNMGFIPAMFSLGGPVGMGIAGMALGFASGTKRFNEFLFGSELLDKDGNPTGKRAGDGLLTRTRNLINTKVIEPIGDAFSKAFKKTGWWIKEAITFPFRKAVGPILDGLAGVKDNITDAISSVFTKMGEGILQTFKTVMGKLFSPLTAMLRFVGKGAANLMEIGTKVTLAPLSMGLRGLSFLTMGKRRKEYMKFYGSYIKNLKPMLNAKWDSEVDEKGRYKGGPLGKIKDVIGAIVNPDDILRENAREGWNEEMRAEGKNSLFWRQVPEEQRELRRQKRAQKIEWRNWARIDKLRQGYIDEYGGREVELRPEALASMRKKFSKLGISEEYLQTSDDIMDLLYRRNDFRKRMKGQIEPVQFESEDQKKSREYTEELDEERNDYLKDIRDMFQRFAFDKNHPDYDTLTEKQQREANRRFKRRAKKYGVEGAVAGISDKDAMRASDISDEGWNNYRNSSFYESGDFAGWLDANEGRFGIPGKKKGSAKQSQVTDALNKIVNFSEASAKASQATAENTIMANQIATGGDLDRDDLKGYRGKSVGKRKLGIYKITQSEAFTNLKTGIGSIFGRFFQKKQRQDKIDARNEREAQEQAEATALGEEGDNIIDLASAKAAKETGADKAAGSVTVKESKSILGTILGTVAGGIGKVKSTKVGSALFGAIKLWGIASLGVGIINALFPDLHLNDNLKSLARRMPRDIENLTDTYVAPFMQNAFQTVGDAFANGAKWIMENGPTVYEQVFKPALTGISNFITVYGPGIIANAANVFTALAPSIVDAFITVVPALAKAAVTGIWNSTAGRWFGGTQSREVTAEEAANLEEMGRQVYTDPNTGIMYELGDRTNVNQVTGEQEKILNMGAIGAVARGGFSTTWDILKHGAKGLGGKVIRTAGKAIGGSYGGLIGTVGRMIPGVGTIAGAGVGAKIGGKIGKGYVNLVSKIGDKISPESIIGKIIGKTATNAANTAAEKTAKEAAEATGEAVIHTLARETGDVVFETATGQTITVLKGGASAAGDTVAKEAAEAAAKTAAKGAGEAAQETAAKGLFAKFKQIIKGLTENKTLNKFCQDAAAENAGATKVPGKLLTKLSGILDNMAEKLLTGNHKILGNIMTKISAKLGAGAVKTFPIVGIVFAGIDGVTGAFEAANLFGIDESQVDGKMRVISALMKVLLGLSVIGPVIDIILEIGSALMGVDYKQEIATFIYGIFSSEEQEAALRASQEQMEIEAQIYNELNNTNLTTSAYNDLKNKGVFSNIGSSIRSAFDPAYRAEQAEQEAKMEQAHREAIDRQAQNEILTEERYQEMIGQSQGLGYGRRSLGYGNKVYSQNNSKWKNMPIGRMPDGSVSTMGRGGCGPTALAIAAKDLGHGSVTPDTVGRYASSRGYISQGGANRGLFTAGAAKFGLAGAPIIGSRQLVSSIASGNPVIISGKSSGGNNPFTRAGHIVVAKGMDRNGNVNIQDPIDGNTKKYSLLNIGKYATNAYAYRNMKPQGYGKSNRFSISRNELLHLGYGYAIPTTEKWYDSDNDYEKKTYRDPEVISNNYSKYLDSLEGIAILLNGDPTADILLERSNGGINDYTYLRTAFRMFRPSDVFRFSRMLLLNQMNPYSTDTNSAATYTAWNNAPNYVKQMAITREELVHSLDAIAKGEYMRYEYDPIATYGSHIVWSDTPEKVGEQSKILARAYADLFKTYGGLGYFSDTVDDRIANDLISALASGTNVNFARLWRSSIMPIDNPDFLIRIGKSLTKTKLHASSDGTSVPIRTIYDQMIKVAATAPTSKRIELEKYAAKIKEMYEDKFYTSAEKAEQKLDAAKASLPELLNAAVDRLNNDSLENYQTKLVNGWVTYDVNNKMWADLKFADGRPFSSEGNNISDKNKRDYIMMLASALTTMTGKPFTPGFIIDYLMPYLKKRKEANKKTVWERSGSNDKPGYINVIGGQYNDSWSSIIADAPELFKSTDNREIEITKQSYSSNIEALRQKLTNGIPFITNIKRRDTSIFPASGKTGNGATAAILQKYFPDTDMLNYMGSEYEDSALYTLGKNLFEIDPEMLATSGIEIKFKNGGGPPFTPTDNQMAINAGDLQPLAAQATSSGPFDLLKQLLSGISSVASGSLMSIMDKEGGSQLIQGGVSSIKGVFNTLRGNNTNQSEGQGLGYGEGDESKPASISDYLADSAGSGFAKIGDAMNNTIGKYLYGDRWEYIKSTSGTSNGSSLGVLPTTAKLSESESKNQIMKYLHGKGFTKNAIAGMMGAWQAESSNRADRVEGDYLNQFPGTDVVFSGNDAMNSWTERLFGIYDNEGINYNRRGYKGTDGNYYPGVGLAQWTGPRGYNLLQYLTKNGYGWGDLEGQLAFVSREIGSGLKSKLNKATSAAEAAKIFIDEYEMRSSGWSDRNPNAYNIRANYANQAYNSLTAAGYGRPIGYGLSSVLEPDNVANGFSEIGYHMGARIYSYLHGVDFATALNAVKSGAVTTDGSGSIADLAGGGSQTTVNAGSTNAVTDYIIQSLSAAGGGNVRITSPFGYRIHPIDGVRKMHNGTDFGAAGGTPVYSVTDGIVDTAQYNQYRGYYVVVKDKVGYRHYYQHLQAGSIAVSVGQAVSQGQLLGRVGSTGASTGNHLHYEIHNPSGTPISPTVYPWNSGAEGYGLGYGNNLLGNNFDRDFNKIIVDTSSGKSSSHITSPLEYDMRTSSSRTTVHTADADVSYGPGPSSSGDTRNLEIALKTGKVEDKLDAIIDVMIDWKSQSMSKSSGGNVTNIINNNGKTTNVKQVQSKPVPPSNTKLRSIHSMVASLHN